MAESKRTTQAVLWSALLHVGVAAFLFLTTLSCTRWEGVFAAFGLPGNWNPMSCTVPLSLAGPVIDATLVGPTRAPLPAPTKAKSPQPAKPKPAPKATPPKPTPPPSVKTPPPKQAVQPVEKPAKPKPAPVKTLPAPSQHPAVRDQQKVVAMAKEKAEQAKREQAEKEKQHMAELQAEQEQKRKQQHEAKLAAERAQQQKQQALEAQQREQKLNDIFKQLDAARAASKSAQKASDQAEKTVAAVKEHKPTKSPTPTAATQEGTKPQSGDNGTAKAAYIAALQNAVTQAWLRPDNIPTGVVCPIHIVQIPGGQVVSVKVEPSCPFDAAGRRSVKNAVLRAEPLPYKGFEKAFRTDITFKFTVK